MVRIAIVEDNSETAEKLVKYVAQVESKTQSIYQTEIFPDAETFLAQSRQKFQLVLLDIELPGMNGMEAARKLRESDRNIAIMFITNMAQYAVKGYEVRAIDYILKPVHYPDFENKLQYAIKWSIARKNQAVTLDTTEGMVRCLIDELFCVQGEKHLITYVTEKGNYTRRGSSIKSVGKELAQYSFIRVSGNCLVNPRCIKRIKENALEVGNVEISVPKSRRGELLKMIAAFFGSQEE